MRGGDRRLGQDLGELVVGRLHQVGVERPGDGQRDDLHGAQLGGDRFDVFQGRQRRRRRRCCPARAGWPSRAGRTARRGGRARRLAGSSRPSTLVMPLGVARAAACIAWPRRRTTLSPASKSIAPAKTRAVYSPRLSPAAPWQAATTSGLARPSGSRAPPGWRRRSPAG